MSQGSDLITMQDTLRKRGSGQQSLSRPNGPCWCAPDSVLENRGPQFRRRDRNPLATRGAVQASDLSWPEPCRCLAWAESAVAWCTVVVGAGSAASSRSAASANSSAVNPGVVQCGAIRLYSAARRKSSSTVGMRSASVRIAQAACKPECFLRNRYKRSLPRRKWRRPNRSAQAAAQPATVNEGCSSQYEQRGHDTLHPSGADLPLSI